MESWPWKLRIDRHKSVEIPIQDDLNKIQPTTSKKKKTPWQSNQNTPKLTQNQQNASKTNTEQLGLKFFTFTADGLGYSITCDGFTGLGPAGGTTRF